MRGHDNVAPSAEPVSKVANLPKILVPPAKVLAFAITQTPGGMTAWQPRLTEVRFPWAGHQPEACVPALARAPAVRTWLGSHTGMLVPGSKPLKIMEFQVTES
jgi:hypothetical protein